MTASPIITLFGKPGCHLCEEVELLLARLRRRYPHTLQRVDITGDPALFQRYQDRIPVLLVAGREYNAPLSQADVERALQSVR